MKTMKGKIAVSILLIAVFAGLRYFWSGSFSGKIFPQDTRSSLVQPKETYTTYQELSVPNEITQTPGQDSVPSILVEKSISTTTQGTSTLGLPF